MAPTSPDAICLHHEAFGIGEANLASWHAAAENDARSMAHDSALISEKIHAYYRRMTMIVRVTITKVRIVMQTMIQKEMITHLLLQYDHAAFNTFEYRVLPF